MLKAILVSLAILSYIPASGQSKKSFEFSVLGRYDQANYVTRFGARSFNDTLKLYGMSYGATISYRQKIYKDISASIGIGYYRLGIDKIKSSSPFSGIPGARPRTSRATNYYDGNGSVLYLTPKYYYNDLLIRAFILTLLLKELDIIQSRSITICAQNPILPITESLWSLAPILH